MLTLFKSRVRRYDTEPVQSAARKNWEFQAVISGRIARTDRTGKLSEGLKSNTLWLSPRFSEHWWTGEPNAAAHIIVLHFRYIPDVLLRSIEKEVNGISVTLSDEQCERLRVLAEQVGQYWSNPAPGMMLCYEHVLLELSLMVYELWIKTDPPSKQSRARDCVEDAIAWYTEHMQSNPSLEDVADVVHVSSAHLRRLFHDFLGASPKRILDQVRYERVMRMLTDTDIKLVSIARECGFDQQSSFTRAFTNRFGCSPSVMRLSDSPNNPEV